MGKWPRRKRRKRNGDYYLAHEEFYVRISIFRVFFAKIQACKQSLLNSRAVRERRSLMYTKLKPIEPPVKRAVSSPGVQSAAAAYNRLSFGARNRLLALETMQDIQLFEASLKGRPNLPGIGVTQSQSSATVSERPIDITTVRAT